MGNTRGAALSELLRRMRRDFRRLEKAIVQKAKGRRRDEDDEEEEEEEEEDEE